MRNAMFVFFPHSRRIVKKSDFGVVTLIYLFTFFFAYQTKLLPAETQAYPSFLLGAIFILNTAYIVQAYLKYRKERVVKDDMSHLFDGFLPKQFFCVAVGCVVYVVLLYTVGYYIASILYMVGALTLLKVQMKWIAVVILALLVVIYLVFSLFLKVPLPVGMLFA